MDWEAAESGMGETTAGMEDIVGPGFFYEDEEVAEEPKEMEGEGIAHRVSNRRRGRRHLGDGQME